MISYYKTVQNHLVECSTPEPGSWVSVVDPTAQERKMLIEEFGLDSDFIKSALDEEESSRVEREDTQTLIIIDTAVSEIEKNDTLVFYTMPMSIIIKDQLVFTISLRNNKGIEDLIDGRLRNIQFPDTIRLAADYAADFYLSGLSETNRQGFQHLGTGTAKGSQEQTAAANDGTGKISGLFFHLSQIQ